jgi:hypothetical protein
MHLTIGVVALGADIALGFVATMPGHTPNG